MSSRRRKTISLADDDTFYELTLEGWRRTLYLATLPLLACCLIVGVLNLFGVIEEAWASIAGLVGIAGTALPLIYLRGPSWIAAPSRRIEDDPTADDRSRDVA